MIHAESQLVVVHDWCLVTDLLRKTQSFEHISSHVDGLQLRRGGPTSSMRLQQLQQLQQLRHRITAQVDEENRERPPDYFEKPPVTPSLCEAPR